MNQIKTMFLVMFFISVVFLPAMRTEAVSTGEGVVCGYVEDIYGVPVNGVSIKIFNVESGVSNTTITDSTGYYTLKIPSGYASLSILDARYLKYGEFLNTSSDETMWFNITLYPPYNATIHGYVSNYTSGQPIADAKVIVDIIVAGERVNTRDTATTDFTGYFEIDTYASENTVLFITTSGYNATMLPISVLEGTSWYNTTLEPSEIAGEEVNAPASLKDVFVSNVLIAQLLIAVIFLVAILVIGNFILVRGKK
ncbi:MAG: carboxypeptidase-like regulatory domain-containing protein [Thermoplasmata archaeon]